MGVYPPLLDNKRFELGDTLHEIAASGDYDELAIATGYWDLSGMATVMDDLDNFKRVRLLIGQEPIAPRTQKALNINEGADGLFPDDDIAYDLQQQGREKNADKMRGVATRLVELMDSGVLEVRVMRKPRLHAKLYVFGGEQSDKAVGIIGSSNFTKAGLHTNLELNYLEDDVKQVLFGLQSLFQPHGHLSWFNEMWDSDDAEEWTGDFRSIVADSPMGDLAWGPYDSYIRTLMEVFPDEMAPKVELAKDVRGVLYDFQDRNAGILLNKLQRMGVAMLADSVGLGKTITAGVLNDIAFLAAQGVIVDWERQQVDMADFVVVPTMASGMDMQQTWQTVATLVEREKATRSS